MEPVIKVEGLSKRYELRRGGTAYSTIRDSISDLFRTRNSKETFWALDDVSFEINQGERVGIIGRNGAGKSTLLKVLSRIVHPTKGRITLEGRIASLLEVGTGFHPELSGRENIFLNGSILGMSKAEIRSRFDEIVAFSEVERFLDTPVKRYSSGMYVRLAFAVAAHLDPEILIVDEVLAVGDAEFQRKCLGKMKDVAGKGRTVILVSHNMAAIQHLCERAIYLQAGKLMASGKSDEVISAYLRASSGPSALNLEQRKDRTGNGHVRFISFAARNKEGREQSALTCGAESILELKLRNNESGIRSPLVIAIGIDDEMGVRVAQLSNELTGEQMNTRDKDDFTVRVSLPHLPLKQGRYNLTVFASLGGEVADWIQDAVTIDVDAGDYFGSGKLPPDGQGHVCIAHSFELR